MKPSRRPYDDENTFSLSSLPLFLLFFFVVLSLLLLVGSRVELLLYLKNGMVSSRLN